MRKRTNFEHLIKEEMVVRFEDTIRKTLEEYEKHKANFYTELHSIRSEIILLQESIKKVSNADFHTKQLISKQLKNSENNTKRDCDELRQSIFEYGKMIHENITDFHEQLAEKPNYTEFGEIQMRLDTCEKRQHENFASMKLSWNEWLHKVKHEFHTEYEKRYDEMKKLTENLKMTLDYLERGSIEQNRHLDLLQESVKKIAKNSEIMEKKIEHIYGLLDRTKVGGEKCHKVEL